MNSHFKQKLLAGLVFGMAAATAMAQTTTSPPKNSATAGPTTPVVMWDKTTFERLDKNKDGKISREEAQGDPMMKDHWTKLDADNKGSIEMSQFEDYGRKLNPNSATPKGHPFDGQKK